MFYSLSQKIGYGNTEIGIYDDIIYPQKSEPWNFIVEYSFYESKQVHPYGHIKTSPNNEAVYYAMQ